VAAAAPESIRTSSPVSWTSGFAKTNVSGCSGIHGCDKLFFALLLIELLVTFIQYTADGALDPISDFGRIIRQLLGAGFILAMLPCGFQLMMLVIQSLGQLGGISPACQHYPQSIVTTCETMGTHTVRQPG
jgi:hypothetical protein